MTITPAAPPLRDRSGLRYLAQRIERPLVDGLFLVLALGLVIGCGWLVARHDRYWDWTQTEVNSLSEQSLEILKRLQSPLRATVFAAPGSPLARAIERFLARYQRALPDMAVQFRDPQLFPEQARDAEVTLVGQILLEHGGRRETLDTISERSIAAGILRLTEQRGPWLAFLEGHGERAIDGEDPEDLGRLADELSAMGFLNQPLDLAKVREVPDNTRILVLSTPRIPLFAGEAEAIGRYLDRGGNLLWLLDPGPLQGLEPLREQLGIAPLPGLVVDAAAARVGAETPAVAVIRSFPDHPLSSGLTLPAMLPGSLAFAAQAAPGWQLDTYLETGDQSWNETGQISGKIDRDEIVGELPGPLPVILALTRTLPDADYAQRVLVVGDGDFVSNAQLNSYGNRALALRLFRWLSADDSLVELPPDPRTPASLVLDERQRLLLGGGALILLPGLFLALGLAIRWHRWRDT